MKKHRAHFGAKKFQAAKWQRRGPRNFLVDDTTRQETETGASVLCRHVKHPEPHIFGFFLEWPQQMLRHGTFAVMAVDALQGNQLLIHEAPHGFFQDLNFFG